MLIINYFLKIPYFYVFSYILINFTFIFYRNFITGYSNFPDIFARLSLNEALFNTYFFFWTNFIYLPFFYFIFTLIILFYRSSKVLSLGLLILFLFYLIEFLDFIIVNRNYILLNPFFIEYNVLLTNTLNKIHPFIFYLSTILIHQIIASF